MCTQSRRLNMVQAAIYRSENDRRMQVSEEMLLDWLGELDCSETTADFCISMCITYSRLTHRPCGSQTRDD